MTGVVAAIGIVTDNELNVPDIEAKQTQKPSSPNKYVRTLCIGHGNEIVWFWPVFKLAIRRLT